MAKPVVVPQSTRKARWEDLTVLYSTCNGALSMVHPVSNLLMQLDEGRIPAEDIKVIKTLAIQMTRDITNYTASVEIIHGKHKGRAGIINDPDMLFTCIAIGEDYQAWISSFEAVIMPVAQDLLNRIQVHLPEQTLPTLGAIQ